MTRGNEGRRSLHNKTIGGRCDAFRKTTNEAGLEKRKHRRAFTLLKAWPVLQVDDSLSMKYMTLLCVTSVLATPTLIRTP